MFFHCHGIFPKRVSRVPNGLPGIGMQLATALIVEEELEAARERRDGSADNDCEKCRRPSECRKDFIR